MVQTAGRQLGFTPKGDRFEDSVELSVVAVDRLGKTRGGERLTLDMPLSEQLRAFVVQAGLVFQIRVPLPPGHYQLRVAGRDAGSGRVGSVHCDVDVPDFWSTPLSVSGIVLTAEEAGQIPNPRPDAKLKELLPASPITTREFAPSDTITLFAEVYDNVAGAHVVQIATSVQDEDGRVRFKYEDPRESSELDGKSGGFTHTARIPVGELGPGAYALRVEARSTSNPDVVASRELTFRVR